MKRFAAPISLLVALAAACALSGCQQIFTTSLAKSLARDTIPLPGDLSASEAASLVEQAKAQQNTKLATALVDNLVGQVGATVTADNADLAAAAAGSAVVASGASTVTMDALKSFVETNTAPTGADLVAIVEALQAGATTNVVTALMYLGDAGGLTLAAATAEGPGAMSATDCAMAAIVLAASALPAGMDPTTLDGSSTPTLAQYQAYPEVDAAKKIIAQAKTLVTDTSLLDQFSDMLKMS